MVSFYLRTHRRSRRQAMKFVALGEVQSADKDVSEELTRNPHGGQDASAAGSYAGSPTEMAATAVRTAGMTLTKMPAAPDPVPSPMVSSSARKKGREKSARLAYPILAPPTPPPPSDEYDNNRDDGPSFQVEMAKSAFLRQPCRERWRELVHCFHVENAERLRRSGEEGGKERLRRIEEEDDEENKDGTEGWASNADMSWANFDGS